MRSVTRSSRAVGSRRGLWRMALVGLLGGIAATALAVAGPAAAEELPEGPAASTLEIEVADCATHFGAGSLHYVVRDPFPFYQDFVTVFDADETIVHEATYADGTEFEYDVALPPGDYEIVYTVERETGGANIDRQAFTVGACPDLDLAIAGTTCSTGADGAVTIMLTGLVPGEGYRWFVSEDSDQYVDAESGSFIAEAATFELTSDGLAPGNPIVFVEWDGDGPMAEWRAFAIDPCQPELTVTLEQCPAIGADAAAEVTASRLVAGVAYRITWPDGSTTDVTGDTSGTPSAWSGPIEPGSSGTVTIEGTWTVDDPYVEPPFIGGGPFTPLETVALGDAAEYRADPCPTSPSDDPTPPAHAGPAVLPPTGLDSTGPLAIAALLLSIGGVLMVLIRRRAVDRD